MVAHVLRLRLALLIGALRVSRTRAIAGLVVAAILAAVGVAALDRLGSAALDSALAVLAVGGSAITAGFALVPLFGAVRDPLDPRRFAVTGAGWATVAAVTLVAAPVSVPAIAVIVVCVALAGLWSAHGVDPVVGVCAAVLVGLTQLLAARVAFGVSGLVLAERRSRELSALFVLALVVVAIPVAVFLTSLDWDGGMPAPLRTAVEVLGLTPLGAAWVFPLAPSVPSLLMAVATPVLLGAAWVLIVRRTLTSTERPVSVREHRGLGWFAVTPGTPGGAVAARSLIYWLRDPRYLVDVAIIPIAAVVTVVPLVIVGVPIETAALIPAPLIALFLGWLAHNDLAYDGSAVWLHVSSAIRGASDRIGRLVPVMILSLPLLAIAASVGVGINGDWSLLPAVLGVCAALLLGGFGLSSVSSVVAPYAVARHGESPFQQPQRTGGGLTQGVVLVGTLLLAAPAVWFAWQALTGDSGASWRALAVGAGTGIVVLGVGIAIGGAFFDRRGDRIMAFAETT